MPYDDPNVPPPPPPPPPGHAEPPPGSPGSPDWRDDDDGLPAPEDVTKDERNMAMFAHIGTVIGTVLGLWGIAIPFVIWLVKKDDSSFVADQAKESMNFQLTILMALAVCIPLICALGIGIVGLIFLPLIAIVMAILGGMRAAEGVPYRYPWTIRLIR